MHFDMRDLDCRCITLHTTIEGLQWSTQLGQLPDLPKMPFCKSFFQWTCKRLWLLYKKPGHHYNTPYAPLDPMLDLTELCMRQGGLLSWKELAGSCTAMRAFQTSCTKQQKPTR